METERCSASWNVDGVLRSVPNCGFITCLALALAAAMDELQQCSTVCKAKYRYQPLIMFHFLSTVKLILQNLSGLQSRNR